MDIYRQTIEFFYRSYKRLISPLLGNNCRFEPYCSDYAREALLRHGFWKGVRLTIWRILRCNPHCKGGQDPVPGVVNKNF